MSASTSSVPVGGAWRGLLSQFGAFLAPAAKPFAISRLTLILVALALSWLLDTGRAHRYEFIGDAPLAPLSATFDANWFASIASEGYSTSANVGVEQNYHFFPLFAFVMWLGATLLGLDGLPGGYNLAGVIVSHVLFLAALGVLYRLALRLFGSESKAHASVWVAAFAPWSFAFSMAYTESLFLLLSVMAVLMAYEARVVRRPVDVAAVSLLVTLAALTRPQGLVLAVPVALLLAFDGKVRSLISKLALLAAIGAPAAVAVAAFVLYIGMRTGNSLALLEMNRNWGDGLLVELGRLFVLPPQNPVWFVDIMSATGLVVWVAVVIVQIRLWLRPSLSGQTAEGHLLRACLALSLVYFAFTVLALPTNSSWGRYMIVVFSNVLILGQLGASVGKLRARLLLALSLAVQVLMLAAAVLHQVTP